MSDGIDTERNGFRKSDQKYRDVEFINRHIGDEREKHMGEDQQTVTSEDIKLDVEEEYIPEPRRLLWNHEEMWLEDFGEINVYEYRIDLNPDAKLYKAPPFLVGPKTRQLEQSEVEKKVKAGVIEPALPVWAAPVLLAPKEDGRLSSYVDYHKRNTMKKKDT